MESIFGELFEMGIAIWEKLLIGEVNCKLPLSTGTELFSKIIEIEAVSPGIMSAFTNARNALGCWEHAKVLIA